MVGIDLYAGWPSIKRRSAKPRAAAKDLSRTTNLDAPLGQEVARMTAPAPWRNMAQRDSHHRHVPAPPLRGGARAACVFLGPTGHRPETTRRRKSPSIAPDQHHRHRGST
jgi:hypothetical protein